MQRGGKYVNSLNFTYGDEKVFNYERISTLMVPFFILRYIWNYFEYVGAVVEALENPQ